MYGVLLCITNRRPKWGKVQHIVRFSIIKSLSFFLSRPELPMQNSVQATHPPFFFSKSMCSAKTLSLTLRCVRF